MLAAASNQNFQTIYWTLSPIFYVEQAYEYGKPAQFILSMQFVNFFVQKIFEKTQQYVTPILLQALVILFHEGHL